MNRAMLRSMLVHSVLARLGGSKASEEGGSPPPRHTPAVAAGFRVVLGSVPVADPIGRAASTDAIAACMAFTVISLKLVGSEYPVAGVALDPWVQCRRDSSLTATVEDFPEEGQAGARFCLRVRWYRSVVQRAGANCWIHPDREATLQCVLCLRCKVDTRKSYHCSSECLRQHWQWHKELHEQRRQNGVPQAVLALQLGWQACCS